MFSAGGRHEWLMSEVVQNIATVEHVLGQLEKNKQQLVDNARQVREEIKSFVQDQVDGIHSREIQLLRQVDVLTNHQMSLLNFQHAHLHQTIGSLKSSLHSLQRCKSDMAAEKIFVEDVKCCKQVKAPPKMHLCLNGTAVQEAIQGFGRVQVDGMLNMTECTTSKCLPSKIEEYMDGDHHLLYKPLHTMHGENDTNVKICFPKLSSSKRLWLAKPNSEEDNIKKEAEHTSLFKLPDTYRSSQIEHWLGQIKRETAVEPLGGEMEDFDFVSSTHLSRSHLEDVDQTHSSYMPSIHSESIEMISDVCDGDMEKHRDEEKVTCCCNESSSTIEIENLDSIPCFSDKDHWLAKEKKTPGKVTSSEIEIPVMMIEKACKANETCSSFKECLCEVNCEIVARESWLDKQQQGKHKWLSSLETSEDRVYPQGKKVPLMFPLQDKDLSYWLWKNDAATVEHSPPLSTRIPYHPPTCTWIHTSPISSPTSGKATFPLPSVFSSSMSTWLRSRACKKENENAGKKKMQQGSILPDSFKSESCTWLKSESTQSDKVHTCKRISVPALFNSEPSVWLKHAEKPQNEITADSNMEVEEPNVTSSLACSALFPQWLLQPVNNAEESKHQAKEANESPGQKLDHDAKLNQCSSPWLKSGICLLDKNMEHSFRKVEKDNLDNEIASQIKWLANIRKNPLAQLKVKKQCMFTGDDSSDLTKWLQQKC